jgi:hypothetical protein
MNNGKRLADRGNGLLAKLENDRTRRSQMRSKNQTPENASAATASTNRKRCTTPVKQLDLGVKGSNLNQNMIEN